MTADIPFKIIGVGLPRTGSLSLKNALEQLGCGPCHHLMSPMYQFNRIKLSAEVFNTSDPKLRKQRLRALYDGFEVVLDLPGSAFVDELVELYPDAKFILTTRRNPDVWLQSVLGWVVHPWSKTFRILGYWTPGTFDSSEIFVAWARLYTARFGLANLPSQLQYTKHCEWVRKVVPKERLLEFEPSMGWDPLCRFIRKEPPPAGKKFPHCNDRRSMNNMILFAMVFGAGVWLVILMLLRISLSRSNLASLQLAGLTSITRLG